jgi:hypothetical protein
MSAGAQRWYQRSMRLRSTIAARLLTSIMAVVAVSPAALAQGLSSNAEAPREGEEVKGDTKVVDIDEVERGVFVSVDYGPGLLHPDAGGRLPRHQPDGHRAGDPLRRSRRLRHPQQPRRRRLRARFAFQSGVINLDDVREGKTTGDIAHIAPGIGARFAFITTERVFAFARVGVGYALWFPSELAGTTGSIHTDASLGIEYYTKLRHVSVGVEADFQALLLPMTFGIHVYPTLKYTF